MEQQMVIAWFAGARFDLFFKEGLAKPDLPAAAIQSAPQVKHGEL
jgi:hypothetical protein